jgi:hypothetical protein
MSHRMIKSEKSATLNPAKTRVSAPMLFAGAGFFRITL